MQTPDKRLISERFPRSSQYHPDWVLASASGGANSLWLTEWWSSDLWCLHSAAWWRWHWERTRIMDIELADSLPDGWQLWLDWQRAVAPDNELEIEALEADRGRCLGYVRLVGRRRSGAKLADQIVSVPTQYTQNLCSGVSTTATLAETGPRTLPPVGIIRENPLPPSKENTGIFGEPVEVSL
jgi:hypothetical protein